MEHVLLVIQVIVTLAMIVAVLIQRSDSDGFGLSGGSGNNLFSGRSASSAMTRLTAILATIFMANALLLGVLAARNHSSSIVEALEEKAGAETSVPAVPAADANQPKKSEKVTPAAEESKADKHESAPKVPAADAEKPAVPEADAGEKAKE